MIGVLCCWSNFMAVKSYLDPQKILDFGVSCSQKWEKGRNIVNSDTDSQVFPAHKKEAQQQSKLSPDFRFPGVVRGAVSGNGSGEEEPHSVSAGSYTPPFTICPIQTQQTSALLAFPQFPDSGSHKFFLSHSFLFVSGANSRGTQCQEH